MDVSEFFFAWGRGRGSTRRQAGAGVVFLIPGRGGCLPGEGGRGEGREGVGEEFVFLFLPKFPPNHLC